MADYLLDTNIISFWYDSKPDGHGNQKPTHRNVVANVQRVRVPNPQTGYVPRFFVSVVTLGEMEYGHRVTPNPDLAKQADYAKFVRDECAEPLELTKHVAEQYGQMKAWLFNSCAPNTDRTKAKRAEQLIYPETGERLDIDENDLWIAAHAMTHGLVLVTHDSRGNFGKVLKQFAASLQVEDWAS